ncbi:MAG: NADH-quinone oxidoreductase subunit NuoK [Lacipirellulaceae bacterium]
MSNTHDAYLALGAVLFVVGALGFVCRRNLILMLLCSELMLHGVSVTLLAFGRTHGSSDGQAFTIFVLTVAACEAGIGLALVLSLYHGAKTLDVSIWSALREAGVDQPEEEFEALPPDDEQLSHEFPSLTPAGVRPTIDADAPLDGQVWPDEGDYGLPTMFRYGPKSDTQPKSETQEVAR